MKFYVDRKNVIDAIIGCKDPYTPKSNYHIVIDGCEFGALSFLDEDAFNAIASWGPLEKGYSSLRKEGARTGVDSLVLAADMIDYLQDIISNCLINKVVCNGQCVKIEYD